MDFVREASQFYLERKLPRYWKEWEEFDLELDRWVQEHGSCNWDCRNYEAIFDDIQELADYLKKLASVGIENLKDVETL